MHLARKYVRIFVRGHYLCREGDSFLRAYKARGKQVSYWERVMSKDKYPSTFSRQMEAIVFKIHILSLGYSSVLAGEYSVT